VEKLVPVPFFSTTNIAWIGLESNNYFFTDRPEAIIPAMAQLTMK
jgi:hypothetical protein